MEYTQTRRDQSDQQDNFYEEKLLLPESPNMTETCRKSENTNRSTIRAPIPTIKHSSSNVIMKSTIENSSINYAPINYAPIQNSTISYAPIQNSTINYAPI
jgi:hypothetical protein